MATGYFYNAASDGDCSNGNNWFSDPACTTLFTTTYEYTTPGAGDTMDLTAGVPTTGAMPYGCPSFITWTGATNPLLLCSANPQAGFELGNQGGIMDNTFVTGEADGYSVGYSAGYSDGIPAGSTLQAEEDASSISYGAYSLILDSCILTFTDTNSTVYEATPGTLNASNLNSTISYNGGPSNPDVSGTALLNGVVLGDLTGTLNASNLNSAISSNGGPSNPDAVDANIQNNFVLGDLTGTLSSVSSVTPPGLVFNPAQPGLPI